ncbi:MAG: VanZ family protein [Candidatus Glassbacteria bacterium]|nr:VanZ family protein [Candidatus Glassbacteria bacterium]
MHLRARTLLFLIAACMYSILLFIIANYLPLITNGAAQILTWVVYARIVRGLVIFLAAVLIYIVFIRFTLIPRRGLFLLQLVPFIGVTAWFVSRLGESVNEYVHYPQYAACVLVWFAALTRLRCETGHSGGFAARLIGKAGPLGGALAISVLLGFAEEGYQYFAPRRTFDVQDILLNVMGVWLGAIIIWTTRDRRED